MFSDRLIRSVYWGGGRGSHVARIFVQGGLSPKTIFQILWPARFARITPLLHCQLLTKIRYISPRMLKSAIECSWKFIVNFAMKWGGTPGQPWDNFLANKDTLMYFLAKSGVIFKYYPQQSCLNCFVP